MILRVLGCSGSEAVGEHHTSFLVGTRVIVDMGSAASRLPIREQCGITDIFLTHAHLDHSKDLGFFAENILGRVKRPVRIHGTDATLAVVAKHLLNDEIWPDFTALPSREEPTLAYSPIEPGRPVALAGLSVLPIAVAHVPGSVGFLLSSPNGCIAYSGDTGPTEEIWDEVNRQIRDMRAVILEASFPDRLADLAAASWHHTPRTVGDVLDLIEDREMPVYLTHLKAPTRTETIDDLESLNDPRIRILEPGMEIEF